MLGQLETIMLSIRLARLLFNRLVFGVLKYTLTKKLLEKKILNRTLGHINQWCLHV